MRLQGSHEVAELLSLHEDVRVQQLSRQVSVSCSDGVHDPLALGK